MLLVALLLTPLPWAHGGASCGPHPCPQVEAPGASSVWAQELADQLGEARRSYADGLEELAAWCHKNGAYARRNHALESLLQFRPDDAKARKSLRYRFDRKANAWIRRDSYRAPSDGGTKTAKEYAGLRDALDGKFVGQAMDAIEAAEENLGPAAALQELRSLYAVAPSQPRLLERLGYENIAQVGEAPKWVSAASVRTPARRREIARWVEESRQAGTQIKDDSLDDVDQSINVEWRQVRQVGPMRLVGRATAKEGDATLTVAATSLGLLSRMVGEPAELPSPWTVYLLERQEDMNRFISSYPGLDDDQRSRARKLGSMWMPGKTRCGVWGVDPVERADMVCKQVAVRFLDASYGIKTTRGWLVEALGLYINYAVVGTRLSRHVAITEYAKPGEVPVTLGLEDPKADWLAVASVCLQGYETSDLARALGRNASEMTPEDVAVTYALVAYLCEGAEPGALKAILEPVGSGTASSVVAIESWFKLPLFEIQLRLQAWLEDVVVAAPEDPAADR